MSYLVTYTGSGTEGQLEQGDSPIYWDNGETRQVEDECIAFYQQHSSVFTVVQVTPSAAELNILDGMTATTAELNFAADVSAQTETIAAAGAVSVSLKISNLALVGAGAVTLAAPNAIMAGQIKTIRMTVDNGDVTMALTNVNNVAGASAGTTCTFAAVSDTLILAACGAKWVVIGINGAIIS